MLMHLYKVTRSNAHTKQNAIHRKVIFLVYTSYPGAPVVPRHAACRQADRHYGQSILEISKYSTFREPGRKGQGVSTLQKSPESFIGQCHSLGIFQETPCMRDSPRSVIFEMHVR